MSELKILKITYKEAEIKVRGKFILNKEERAALYLLLREYFNIQEALILSTCNRTEIYYVHEQTLSEKIMSLLMSFKRVNSTSSQPFFASVTDGNEALRHLFNVGVGLDSKVLGDIQIFGQVKEAYQEAIDLGMTQTFMHRALHTLFNTHKQMCQETSFKTGAASVSYNAVKILLEENRADYNSKVLVIGAGKMGTDVCKNLVHSGFRNVTVTNRSQEKSIVLQQELNIEVLPYSELFPQLDQHDILISTISSPQPVFDHLRLKKDEKKFVCVDLSAPASFSEKFVDKYTHHYFNIDRIGIFTEETISRRKREIPKVRAIIHRSLTDFHRWEVEFGYTRHVTVFKATLDQLRKESIARYIKKIDETQFELIDEISKSIIQRIIKLTVIQMKQACERGQAEQLGLTINQIFNPEYNPISNLNMNNYEHL